MALDRNLRPGSLPADALMAAHIGGAFDFAQLAYNACGQPAFDGGPLDRIVPCSAETWLAGSILPGGRIALSADGRGIEHGVGAVPWDYGSFGQAQWGILPGNVLTRRQPLDLAAWSISGIAPSSAPDRGALRFYEAVGDSGTGGWSREGVDFTAGQAETLAVLVDAEESTSAAFAIVLNDGAPVSAVWNLTGDVPGAPTVAAGAWTNVMATAAQVAGSIWRLTLSATPANTTTLGTLSLISDQAGAGVAIIGAPMASATPEFFGIVGGDQEAVDVVAPEASYRPNARILQSIRSVGALTAIAGLWSSRPLLASLAISSDGYERTIGTNGAGLSAAWQAEGTLTRSTHAAGPLVMGSVAGAGSASYSVNGSAAASTTGNATEHSAVSAVRIGAHINGTSAVQGVITKIRFNASSPSEAELQEATGL